MLSVSARYTGVRQIPYDFELDPDEETSSGDVLPAGAFDDVETSYVGDIEALLERAIDDVEPSSGEGSEALSGWISDVAPLLVQQGSQKRTLRVAAFNVQVFGVKKLAKTQVVASLLKVRRRMISSLMSGFFVYEVQQSGNSDLYIVSSQTPNPDNELQAGASIIR